MNKEDLIFLFMCVVCFVGGIFLGRHEVVQIKKEAITKGVAYYNPTNANFEWKNLADANKTN